MPEPAKPGKLFATKDYVEGLLPENYGHIHKPGTPRKPEKSLGLNESMSSPVPYLINEARKVQAAKKGVAPGKKPTKPPAKAAEAPKPAAAEPTKPPEPSPAPAAAPPAEAPPAPEEPTTPSPPPEEALGEEREESYDEERKEIEDLFEDMSSYDAEPTNLADFEGLLVQKPHDIVVETGRDFVVKISINGTHITAKPGVKWFKGKWLELGSKSGTRYKFENSYDEASKGNPVQPKNSSSDYFQKDEPTTTSWLYFFQLKVFKAVKADQGSYRCEVIVPDKCENCMFNVKVEAASDDGNILQAFKRTTSTDKKRKDDAGELDFSALLKKTEKEKKEQAEQKPKKKGDDDPMDNIPPHVWEILKNAKPSEYEKIAFQHGVTDLRGMLKHLKKKKVEIKKSEAFTKKLDNCYTVDKGQRIKLQIEVSNPDLPVKWLKNGQVITPSAKYVFENVGLRRVLTINKCTLADDAEYVCVIGDERTGTELFVKEPPVTIEKPLEDQQVFVGDKVELEVEVSEEGAQVIWMKDGIELTREETFKYRFKKDGKKHVLIINEATKEDTGRYTVQTNGGECEADLVVEDKKLEVLQGIADLTVKAAEQAVFKCEVSDEKVTGKWLKNGVEIRPSKRITMTHKGRIHKLIIDDVRPEDEADYTFVPDGYALSLSAKLNFLEVVIEYVPLEEPPKIHLDCTGATPNTIIVVAGNKMRFDVPITGEPAPTVTWFKENKEFADIEGRVRIEPKPDLSSFFIDGAKREDEGNYKIVVANPSGEDTAQIYVKVVDIPDPPQNIRITSVGEDWAEVIWDPPKYDGGQPITGYLIERKKKGSQRWMKMNFELFTDTKYESTNMIEGVLYEIRVFAVNIIGISNEANTTNPFMPIAPTSEPLHLKVEDVTDTTCTLKWRPPDRIGAGGIDGYLIEYCKEGSDEWVATNTELVERCGYTAKGLPTGEKLIFRVIAMNIAGKSEPAVLGQAVTIREIVQSPKIRLPRQLRQTYVKRVGEQVNLLIPFQGKPRPKVTWTKDNQPLDPKQVSVRTSESDTILFIRSSERPHSGKYVLTVQIENMADSADINIRIVDKPGPAHNVMVKEVWGFNAFLEWQPPKDNGNSEITGYTIQKADKKTMEWFTVYEHNRQTRCTVSDLIVGNEYYFRVYSENVVGLGDNAGVSKNTAVIQKTGLMYKPRDYEEMDTCSAPRFLTPLINRSVVAGYSTALNCAVKGHPKPKVHWFKNKIEIKDDPKFLMKHNQGVLTLNIRKPSPFDGGTYTCKAINELGEAEVDCKLEVRVPQ